MNMQGKEGKGRRNSKSQGRQEAKGKENARPKERRTRTSLKWQEKGVTRRTMRYLKEMNKNPGGFEGGKGKTIIPSGPPGGKKARQLKEKELKGMYPNAGPQQVPKRVIQPDMNQHGESNQSKEHHDMQKEEVKETMVTEDSYEILSTEPIPDEPGNHEDLSTTEEG